jgi:hypothetical protein
VTAAVMGALGLVCVLLMPRGKPAALRDRAHGHELSIDAVAPDAEVFVASESETRNGEAEPGKDEPGEAEPVRVG